jgi:hypothetical protein
MSSRFDELAQDAMLVGAAVFAHRAGGLRAGRAGDCQRDREGGG